MVARYANNWLKTKKASFTRTININAQGAGARSLKSNSGRNKALWKLQGACSFTYIYIVREVVLGGGGINSGSSPPFGTESGLGSPGLPKHKPLACVRLHDRAPPPS